MLLLAVSAVASAQPLAALQGRVFDVSGSALPNASIIITDPSTGFNAAVVTDAEGRYYIPGIPAGAYGLTAAASG
jgi:protocatechuate 3,4-dioxygenase beta subunit